MCPSPASFADFPVYARWPQPYLQAQAVSSKEVPINPSDRNASAVDVGDAGRMLQETQQSGRSAMTEPQSFLKSPGPPMRQDFDGDLGETMARHARHEGLVQAVFGGDAGKKVAAYKLAEALMTGGDYAGALPLLQNQLDVMKQIDPADQLQEQMSYRRSIIIRDMTEAIERTSGEKAAYDFFFKEMKVLQLAQAEQNMVETLSKGEKLTRFQIRELALLLQDSSFPLSAGKLEWLRNTKESDPVVRESGQYVSPLEEKETIKFFEELHKAELEEQFKQAINKPAAKTDSADQLSGNPGNQGHIEFPPLPHELTDPPYPNDVDDTNYRNGVGAKFQPKPDHAQAAESLAQYFGRQNSYVAEEFAKAAADAQASGQERLADAYNNEARIITSALPKQNRILNEALMMYGSSSSAEFAVQLSMVAEAFADAGDVEMAYKVSFATVGMLESIASKPGDYTRIFGMHNQLARFSEGVDASAVQYHKRKAQEWADLRDKN